MKEYLTVKQASTYEMSISKSKFIAHVLPTESEEEANAFIEQVNKKHYNATHNVPVYLLGEDMAVQKYSDDGEPSGTAGIPILEMLKHEGITNVCIVITRYFGGIKLGTGGLVRAYTESAKMGLKASTIVKKVLYRQALIAYDYPLHGMIENLIRQDESIVVEESIFEANVTLKLSIQSDRTSGFEKELIELSSGQIHISWLDEVYKSLASTL